MRSSRWWVVVPGALVLALSALLAHAQQPAAPAAAAAAAVDPKADDVLRKMGTTLQAAQSLSFTAHAIVDQAREDGQRVQYAKNQKVRLRRPDKLAGDVSGDVEELQFRYDGKEVAIYNARTNSWGAVPAPATVEAMLDMLALKYGIVMPLADLAFPDPYRVLIQNVQRGEYVGTGYVFDTKCHHLAFRQSFVDWQIWIEDGERALPRKVVITFKDRPAHPQYTAFLSEWKLATQQTPADDVAAAAPAAADAFTLKPPAGAKKVDFTPATQPTAPAAGAR